MSDQLNESMSATRAYFHSIFYPRFYFSVDLSTTSKDEYFVIIENQYSGECLTDFYLPIINSFAQNLVEIKEQLPKWLDFPIEGIKCY